MRTPSPRSFFFPLLCSVASFTAGAHTLSKDVKQAALHKAVSVLPYGQTIGVEDLPSGIEALSSWMSKLDNAKPISLVSIPATHDAGTALGRYGWSRCQILNVPAQLKVGVRGFDIRLRLVEDTFKIYHGNEYQRLEFMTVMTAFQDFLSKHPTEFLVMRVREEKKADRPKSSFENAFVDMMKTHGFEKLFYKANSRTEIPKVGQVRGKIVLIDNYGKLPDCIDYPNPTMSVQDDYDINDMRKKYNEIVQKFEDALAEKSGATWHINYTSSCSALVDQISSAKANNAKVEEYLKGKKGNLGLVLMNFPSLDVIRSIVESNQ